MPALPRGTCLACKRDVALRSSGVTREHVAEVGGRKCRGSAMRSRGVIERDGNATEAERKVAGEHPIVLLRPASEAPSADECWPGHPHRWGPINRVKLGPQPRRHESWRTVGVRACKCGALANVDTTVAYVPIEAS